MDNRIKVIITGATGMVGEGVVHECLLHPAVESVIKRSWKPGILADWPNLPGPDKQHVTQPVYKIS